MHCRVCKSHNIEEIYDFGIQPFSLTYLDSPDQDFSSHPLMLSLCRSCGFVFIPNPVDPEQLYSGSYVETAGCPVPYLPELIATVDRLSPKKCSDAFVIEIGCNDGTAMAMFRDYGFTNILGVEPSQNCSAVARSHGLNILNSFFDSTAVADITNNHSAADIVLCRHVIEHIVELDDFMQAIVSVMHDDSLLVLEFPNFDWIATAGSYMSIMEQHVNYFGQCSFKRLLSRFGFTPVAEKHYRYAMVYYIKKDQSAKTGISAENELDLFFTSLTYFKTLTSEYISQFKSLLADTPGPIAAFGAGGRGMSMINNSNISSGISWLIDDDKAKCGKYVPFNKLPILPSSSLTTDPPQACIVLPMLEKSIEYQIMHRFADYVRAGGTFIEVFPGEGPYPDGLFSTINTVEQIPQLEI